MKGYHGKHHPRLLILNAYGAFSLVSAGKLNLAAYDGEVIMLCNIPQELWGVLMTTPCEVPGVFARIKKMREELDRLTEEDRVVFIREDGTTTFTNTNAIDQLASHRWYDVKKPLFGKDEAIPPYDNGEHLKARIINQGYKIDVI